MQRYTIELPSLYFNPFYRKIKPIGENSKKIPPGARVVKVKIAISGGFSGRSPGSYPALDFPTSQFIFYSTLDFPTTELKFTLPTRHPTF